jgi:CDP-diacylglycerol--glycerol-3-phosphate 3-phosphatidyltransferase
VTTNDSPKGRFRARDLLLVPGLLSLARVPLGIAFIFVVDTPWAAFLILVLASSSDVLDGWYARRYKQVTPTGAVIDPVTDKLFVLSVVVSLWLHRHLSLLGVLLLSTREMGELPLVFWFVVSQRVRRVRATKASANAPGKAVTTLQFVTIAAALFHMPMPMVDALLYATAGAGVIAALAYWIREVSAVREPASQP